MKALIIDSDESYTKVLESHLIAMEILAHSVHSHERALEILRTTRYDLVFAYAPSLEEARKVVRDIRFEVGREVYVYLLAGQITQEEAIAAGANDVLHKPFDRPLFEEQIQHARNLVEVADHLGDISEDFPSAGGVIAKSAFNQLFLSAIDRSARYGESVYILFISIANYADIKQFDGPYAANYAAAKLSQYVVGLRRQTDIVGQTRAYEFALLLQRPERASEPVEAAQRFANTLRNCKDIALDEDVEVKIKVSLVNIPVGSITALHEFSL